MKQRNYILDLVKLYFAFCVALGHSHIPTRLPLLNMDYVVTLFFILSGYFMIRSLDSGKYKTPWQYTMSRVCRIWPHYFFAFVMLFLFLNLSEGAGIRELVWKFCGSLSEILMLQNTGIFTTGINYPAWQLSTLIFASHILFSLAQWNRHVTVNVLCPLIAACSYACLGQDLEYWGVTANFVYIPLLRAMAGLSVGMFLYDPITQLLEKMEHSSFRYINILVSAVTVILLPILWINRNHATLIMLPFIGILICLLYPGNLWGRLFRHPVLRHLDMLSLGIYMNHALLINLFDAYTRNHLFPAGTPVDLIFVGLLILISILFIQLVNGFCALCKRAGSGNVKTK